jgi:hypothetical protein
VRWWDSPSYGGGSLPQLRRQQRQRASTMRGLGAQDLRASVMLWLSVRRWAYTGWRLIVLRQRCGG